MMGPTSVMCLSRLLGSASVRARSVVLELFAVNQACPWQQSGPPHSRTVSASAAAALPDIVVPALGESVSEGTVAAIVKRAGEQVQVDDVLVQLETDKVTIDVKSTAAGVLHAVKVQIGDTVRPGSILAVVSGPTDATGNAAPAASDTPQAVPSPSDTSSGRVPMIHFPPRRTADGRQISALPSTDTQAALQNTTGSSHGVSSPASQSHTAPSFRPDSTTTPVVDAKVPTAPSAKPSLNTTYLKEKPARREMTAREIDLINGGGAQPGSFPVMIHCDKLV